MGLVVPFVTLCRGDVADATVAVFLVVPMHKRCGPGAGLLHVGKAP